MRFNLGLKSHFLEQEYLCTNGIGGFCSNTVLNTNTRKYHGVLCASLTPPTDRQLILNHLIETIKVETKEIPLSQELYQRKPEIESLPPLQSFTVKPFPNWQYEDHRFSLKKECWMTPGENTTNITYTNTGKSNLTLNLKPLLSLRGYHGLRQQQINIESEILLKKLLIKSDGFPIISIGYSRGQWTSHGHWYESCYYPEEKLRGYDSSEDNFCPKELTVVLAPQENLELQISVETNPLNIKQSLKQLEKRNKKLTKNSQSTWEENLTLSANQFIVERKSINGKTILAGYPWFTDWGRDTLISLRGFQYFLDKKDIQSIIFAFLEHETKGLIPNRFPDNPNDHIEYNTADATLWIFVILKEIFDFKKDKRFIKKITPILQKIINHHIEGTSHGIKCEENGLLQANSPGYQLTWMDAKIGNEVITPRSGFPVEINCLWYNALKIFYEIDSFDQRIEKIINRFENSFEKHFWIEDSLADFLTPDLAQNTQIRPNQIWALSLPFSPLSTQQQESILNNVSKHLYTPLGLRSLEENDNEFQAYYQGGAVTRDRAYHQGTVWTYLLLDYWKAYKKIHGNITPLKKDLEVLKNHFYQDGCLHGVSEVFDGKTPKRGKGCINQAWSVAALLWIENNL